MALTECLYCMKPTGEYARKCRNCGKYLNPDKEIDDLKVQVDFLTNELLQLKNKFENIPVAELIPTPKKLWDSSLQAAYNES